MPLLSNSNRFENLDILARCVGELLTERYAAREDVLGFLCGVAAQQRRFEQLVEEASLLQNRNTCPVTATTPFELCEIVESDRRSESGDSVSYSAPERLTRFAVAEIVSPTGDVSLAPAFDVGIDDGRLVFFRDPFLLFPEAVRVEIDSERSIKIKLHAAEYDRGWMQAMWQPSTRLSLPSTRRGLDVANAVLDSHTKLPSMRSLLDALTAAFDVPFAKTYETVIEIERTSSGATIVTDVGVYAASVAANLLVGEGDALQPGEPITDAIQIFEPRGQAIPSFLSSLTLDHTMLWQNCELGFENTVVALTVQTGVSGYTKISFPLVGDSGDAADFFSELHARGVAQAKTLANYLDIRPTSAQVGQPTADSLPKTVNPMKMLCDYVLQGSTLVFKVDPAKFGNEAIPSLSVETLIRKMVSPHVNVIVA